MKIFYKILCTIFFVNLGTFLSFGQQGNFIITSRAQVPGIVSFSGNISSAGFRDSKHVDGYVKKYGAGFFSFPVGQNGVYRPFAAEADETLGAYYKQNPSQTELAGVGPVILSSKEESIQAISNIEYWDIKGANSSKLTLTWDLLSKVEELTGDNLNLLSIVGWNQASARWENIVSNLDQTSIFGTQSSLSSGSITTIEALVPNKYSLYSLGALSSSSIPSNFNGSLEVVSCTKIEGWIWDANYPNADITIELFEGNTVYATSKANIHRNDLQAAGVGTGNYGFSFATPSILVTDGIDHQLNVRIKGRDVLISESPKTLNCALKGNIDVMDCYSISGWVWDGNDPSSELVVEVLDGSEVITSTTANLFREELKTAGYGTGKYGFRIETPRAFKDGKVRHLSIRAKDKNYTLNGSPKVLACASSAYYGNFEQADCNTISGWVWDKSYPDAALTVEIMDGSIVVASVEAGTYKEYIKTAGYGTGKYSFRLETPQAIKDSKPHQLSVRVKGGNYLLNGAPKNLTCASNDYYGNLEMADCNAIGGWVWDKINPDSVVIVEIMDGNKLLSSVEANIFKENIKNAGYGTGKYGFRLETPRSLKDGMPHQLSVRVKGSVYILNSSPKTVTCAGSDYFGNFEMADCNAIGGWVWDRMNPDSVLIVEVMDGNIVLGTVSAGTFKESVKNAGYGTGKYGFRLETPRLIKDGKLHQLSVRVKGTSYILASSPRNVTCASNSYYGNFELADCNGIGGWVWDKNNPDSVLTVEILDGSTVLASVQSGTYKEYVKNAGYGSGKYGFRIDTPKSLKDGYSHQLSARVKGSTYALLNSPRTVKCASNMYYGNFEMADCNGIGGWVWDKNNPDSALTVEILDGSTVIASLPSGTYKDYVKNAGYGSGKYGFRLETPQSIKDGRAHQLSVRVKGSSYVLGNSPRTVTCASNNYYGNFELADCNGIGGWVWDKNNPNAALTVEILDGGTVLASVESATYKEYVKNAGYGTGMYGFRIETPQSLKDGKPHQLSVRVKGSSYLLGNSPRTVTCASNVYYGNLELADCNGIGGWVWDKNKPNAILTVEVLNGSTVIASVESGMYKEYVKNAGYGTGKYGFRIDTPKSLKDGKSHQLSIRVKGSSYVLNNSSRTVTCASVNYYGNFELADCNGIGGWVWDKNNPDSVLTVEILDGSKVLATVESGTYKEYVKNAGYGTGEYGFRINTPQALKDGQPHQLSVRVKGSSYVLGYSPRTVTCTSNARLTASNLEETADNSELHAEMVLAPNPVKNHLSAKFYLNKNVPARLTIINILGNTIWSAKVTGRGELMEQVVDLSMHMDGIYLFKLDNGTRVEVKRILLVK